MFAPVWASGARAPARIPAPFSISFRQRAIFLTVGATVNPPCFPKNSCFLWRNCIAEGRGLQRTPFTLSVQFNPAAMHPRSALQKMGTVASLGQERSFGSNRWICHTGERIWLIVVDANENPFASFDPPSN